MTGWPPRLAVAALVTVALSGSAQATTIVSCGRLLSDLTFRGEHIETVAAGVFDGRTGRIVASSDGTEVFIVAKVRVLEVGDVPSGFEAPTIGAVVDVLQRLPCTNCDASRTADRGGYSNVGDVLWYKATMNHLGGDGGYEDRFGEALVRTAVSYQFVLASFCDASLERNWTLMPD